MKAVLLDQCHLKCQDDDAGIQQPQQRALGSLFINKPNCLCNVCTNVKRRFKTLMLRKKKRQEREAEIDREKKQIPSHAGAGLEGTSDHTLLHVNGSENETERSGVEVDVEVSVSSDKGHLDLNSDPNREDDALLSEATGMSLTSGVHSSSVPSDMCTERNVGPTFGACLISQTVGENEEEHGAFIDMEKEKPGK